MPDAAKEGVRRGRPPLRPEDRRTLVLRVRVSAAEQDALYRRAFKERLPLAAIVRRELFGGRAGA